MTAYSFGNRWVGIVALREPDPSGREPLHRMAARLRRPITVADAVMSRDEAVALLARLRHRFALRGDWSLVAECERTEDAIRIGLQSSIRAGLAVVMGREESRRKRAASPSLGPSGPPRASRRKHAGVRVPLLPAPPTPPGLPLLPPGGMEVAACLGVAPLDPVSGAWLRWASVHASYAHENHLPGVSHLALEMLAGVGHRWLQLAVIQEYHRRSGDLVTPDTVHSVARTHTQVRDALSEYLQGHGLGLLSRGEHSAGRLGGPSRAIAMQVLGALCLTTGSHRPAVAAVRRFWTPAADSGTDWVTLVQNSLGYAPELHTSSEGPDHARRFTVTLRDRQGRSATGSGTSTRLARRDAHRAYAHTHARDVVPTTPATAPRRPHSPSPLRGAPAAHVATVGELARVFDLPASAHGLLTEALVHGSWAHENRRAAEASDVRSNATLAALGSFIAPALTAHHFAAATLQRSLTPDAEQARLPDVPAEHMARLGRTLAPGGGALYGKGTTPATNQHAEVGQAILGATWLAGGATLDRRVPDAVATWLAEARNNLDAVSQLVALCTSIDCSVELIVEPQGLDHERAFRATCLFGDGNRTQWSGPWETNKARAKLLAASSVLDLILSLAAGDLPNTLPRDQAAVLAQLLWAEAVSVARRGPEPRRDVTARRLGVDLVVSGSLDRHGRWSAGVERVLAGSSTLDTFNRAVSGYYRALLARSLRDALREALAPVRRACGTGEMSPEAQARTQAVLAVLEAVTSLPTDDLGAAVRDACAAVGTTPHGLGAEYPRSAPGTAGVGAMLVRLSAAVASAVEAELEVAVETAEGDIRVILRADGADLPATLGHVLDVVALLVPQLRVAPQDGAVLMVAPAVTQPPLTPLGRAAADALANRAADPWLAGLVEHLRGLLDSDSESDDDGWQARAQRAIDHLREPVREPAARPAG
ncbi:hypothetical protein KG103_02570 [Cellulomonas wangleii]|uniref:DRBM domain-containing protein n=2 Tax=Cellulomonas wangleii TaxID=2816956 RepID=A0ABX8D5X3_9CELL|nr:hypothetical protein [Cellulomonas wangleii]QVI62842.1 hypothetical protein KG103_02570 [Cellulomonas wangleii]